MNLEVPIVDVRTPQALNDAIQNLQADELLVLDFWAPWCQPCRTLTPVLERLARRFAPRVIIAKINIDEQPELAAHLRVQSIPAVKFIVGGKIVGQFVGAQPEAVVEDYIRKLLPTPTEQKTALDAARELLAAGQVKKARVLAESVVKEDAANIEARFTLARCLIMLGETDAARAALSAVEILNRADEQERLELLITQRQQCETLGGIERAAAAAQQHPDDLNAACDYAGCLILAGQYDAACQGLLQIIERDKNVRGGAARKLLLAVFDILGSDPRVSAYRRRLASALFI
jgi:putative thioredoxin